MRSGILLAVVIFIVGTFAGCNGPNEKERLLSLFTEARLERIKPLEKQAALASWRAAVTGDPAEYKQASALTLRIRGRRTIRTRRPGRMT